ncbi:hypothetical protein ACFQL1_24055 [Halomicroarcula sp. GCM10025709]|uniref:hypothetical protein n=1 Tax=Halomicroarcula sp. GCM10025709 TaxID=3252669 RepID=UPI0036195C0C
MGAVAALADLFERRNEVVDVDVWRSHPLTPLEEQKTGEYCVLTNNPTATRLSVG